jgi:hypothetical protein
MKNFKEFLAFDELDEGVASSATVLAYARRSKVAGDKAVRTCERGLEALKQGLAGGNASERFKRIEVALNASLAGQIATRDQIGNLMAAVAAAQVMKRK